MRFVSRSAFALAVTAICAVPRSSLAQMPGPGSGACDTIFGCGASEPLPTIAAAKNPETGLPALFEVNLVTGAMTFVTDVTLSADPPVCGAFGPLGELDRLTAIEFNAAGELFGFGWDLDVPGASTAFAPVGSLLRINLEAGTAHALCPLPIGAHGYTSTTGINAHPIVADHVVGSSAAGAVIEPVTLAAGTNFALSTLNAGTQIWLNSLNGVPTELPGASPFIDWEMVCRGFTVSNHALASRRLLLCSGVGPSFESLPTFVVQLSPENTLIASVPVTTTTGEWLSGKLGDLHCDASVCIAPADRSYRDPGTNELVAQQPVVYTFTVSWNVFDNLAGVSPATVLPLTYAGFPPEETPVPEDVFFEVGPVSVVRPETVRLEEVLDFLIECPPEPLPPLPPQLPCVRPWFRDGMAELTKAVSSARWIGATERVHALMQATDGCMFRGRPDAHDGIVGCELRETTSILPDGTRVSGRTDTGPQRWVHGALNRIFVATANAAMRRERIRVSLNSAKFTASP